MNDTKNAGNGGGERRIDRYILHERISLHSPTEQFDGRSIRGSNSASRQNNQLVFGFTF